MPTNTPPQKAALKAKNQAAPKSKANPKSSAHYQREFRKRLREQGLVKKEAWIIPENGKLLSLIEKDLRQHIEPPTIGNATALVGDAMLAHNPPSWTIQSLFEALCTTDMVTQAQAKVTILDDANTLEIILHEAGDLPLLLTIAGQQMLVEAVLWAVDDVQDPAIFDAAVLRTHKYFPLSTIGIETFGDNQDYYTLFGALSTCSLLANILLEIETLGANVIQAANAYCHFLKTDLIEPSPEHSPAHF